MSSLISVSAPTLLNTSTSPGVSSLPHASVSKMGNASENGILRVLDAVPHDNFGVLYDTSHGHMCAVVGARHNGEKEILPGGQLELIEKLSGKINHIHLIDSDDSCHKDANGEDETSMHLPFGEGVVQFGPIVERLAAESLAHDWWTIDLCFWPDAWEATERCKKSVDEFVAQHA